MTSTSEFGFLKKQTGNIDAKYLSPSFQIAFIEIQTTSMIALHLEASKNRKKEKTNYN